MKLSYPILCTMLVSSDIWAVYGVDVRVRYATESSCVACTVAGTAYRTLNATQTHTLPFESPLPATTHPSSSTPAATQTPDALLAPPASSHEPPSTYATLDTPAKAGLIAGASLLTLLAFFIVLEFAYLRRKRRERALRQAIEEVERGEQGLEMKVWPSSAGDVESTETKENLVLESRVEILVDGEDSSSDEEGWGADVEDSEDEDERGRGRKGLSLPRRVR
ncbi:hypothetical protein ACN47E_010000 [Coniothyrium glycines]